MYLGASLTGKPRTTMNQELLEAGASITEPIPFPLPEFREYESKSGMIYFVAMSYGISRQAIHHVATLDETGVHGRDIMADMPDELEDYDVFYLGDDCSYYRVDEDTASNIAEAAFDELKENYDPAW